MKTEQLIELVRDYARPEDVQRLIQAEIVDHWIKWGICAAFIVFLVFAAFCVYKLCNEDI
jgi:hypothetical protein